MKTSSCKAKGRRASQEVKELLMRNAPDLEDGDLIVTPSGVPGVDIHLSPRALKRYPLVIECKNQESIKIWAALKQAESHKKSKDHLPVLFFRRNHSKLYVSLEAEDFVKLISKANQ